MEEGVGIPKNLEVDPTELGVEVSADTLDGLAESIHILQKLMPRRARQIGKTIGHRIVSQEDAVPG